MPSVPTRRAVLLTSAALATKLMRAQSPPTAQQLVDRIKKNVGVAWNSTTVDNVIYGDAATPVTGIATTMMATLDVIERAAAANKNFVITHEPTFYSHLDTTDRLQNDSTYRYKIDFMKKHQMVVFRFHDHWHARQPDGIALGMARELGWERNADSANIRQFTFPQISLANLAQQMQSRLKIRTMRVVGDPNLPIRQVAANWGYASQFPGITDFAAPNVDAFVVGETREWEVVEYAQDSITAGNKKALIILGHVVSEQAGMKYCAEWLKTFIPDTPIEFVPAVEPFWRPLL
jgi:putative NIF3 family GTP cyclohydrolase 1 type 2